MTVYWVVWDDAAHWIVDRLDREGALPAVRRLRAAGVTAARPPRPNCQTPPSLATLFTGSWPRQHAVTGFTVPGGPHDPVDSHLRVRAGIPGAAAGLAAGPARGLRTAFVHVPWVFDGEGAVGPGVNAAVEAYSNRICGSGILPLADGPRQDWPAGAGAIGVRATAAGARLVTSAGTHDLEPV